MKCTDRFSHLFRLFKQIPTLWVFQNYIHQSLGYIMTRKAPAGSQKKLNALFPPTLLSGIIYGYEPTSPPPQGKLQEPPSNIKIPIISIPESHCILHPPTLIICYRKTITERLLKPDDEIYRVFKNMFTYMVGGFFTPKQDNKYLEMP